MADQTADDSVFDFLYVDRQRIEVYLSQFGQYGHLKSMMMASLKSELTEGAIGFAGNKFGGNSKSDETLTSNYDAQWLAPLRFLDELATRGLGTAALDQANIGNFVLCKGHLSVLDMASLERMWSLKSLRDSIEAGVAANSPDVGASRADRRRSAKQEPKKAGNSVDFVFDIMGLVPHGAQAYMVTTSSHLAWASLGAAGMVTSASDIMLNHGATLSGEWAMLGVLDAKPTYLPTSHMNEMLARVIGVDLNAGQGIAPHMFLQFAPAVRNVIGRPDHAYGLTPLLIFREVSG